MAPRVVEGDDFAPRQRLGAQIPGQHGEPGARDGAGEHRAQVGGHDRARGRRAGVEDGRPVTGDEGQRLVHLDHGDVLQVGCAGAVGPYGAGPLRPVGRGDQDVLLVAERGRREQCAARSGRPDGQIVMPGRQALQRLLGGPERGAQGEALPVLTGEPRERGQGPLGGELRRPGQMQGAQRGAVVQPGLGDLHQRVEMRGGLVGEFVADGRRGHTAGLAEEQGAPELPLQGADLGGDRRLGEAEQGRGAREGTGPVHGHERAKQGQIHQSRPLFCSPATSRPRSTINMSIGRCRYCDWTLTDSQLA